VYHKKICFAIENGDFSPFFAKTEAAFETFFLIAKNAPPCRYYRKAPKTA
jgi:hypothetical protein